MGLGYVGPVRRHLHADEGADGAQYRGRRRFGRPARLHWVERCRGSWEVLAQPAGLALFLVLFLWQFPHFMAIAWIYRQQYERAGLRMMTVVEPTGFRAGWYAVVAALLLLPVSWTPALLLPWNESMIYLLIVTLLGVIQLRFATRFLLSRTDQTARALLRVTLLYLPLLLVALVIHAI